MGREFESHWDFNTILIMKQHLSINLNFKIGQEFEDTPIFTSNKVKFRICSIEITLAQGAQPQIIYNVEEYKHYYNNKFYWSPSPVYKGYTEKQLSNILGKTPYTIEPDVKFSLGDIIVSGVNGQIPDQIETYKNSSVFFGNIFEVQKICITIYADNKLNITYRSNNILYDGFIKQINPPYKNCNANELWCGLLSDLDIDTLIDIKCNELSKKIYIDDYNNLYKNYKAIVNSNGYYQNTYAGLFKFLNVEEKAMDIFYQYIDMRMKGKRKLKQYKPKSIDSLNKKEIETLIKKLQEN